MKVIAINGSPRKQWNTHILLEKSLEGARSEGAETELVNLYDLNYTGCTSCLACKVKGGKSLGYCSVKDDLKQVLDEIDSSDALIVGSPIYLGDISAMTQCFLERLYFQYLSYDNYAENYFKGSLRTAGLFTMNVSEDFIEKIGYDEVFKRYEELLGRYFTYTETLLSTETLQVKDYSKYHMGTFNEDDRKKRREEVFPLDCEKAFELGRMLAQ